MEAGFRLIEKFAIAIAAVAVLAAGAIICINIAGRTAFRFGIPDAEIIIQDLMVLAVMLPLATVAGRRAHIAVDVVVRRLAPRTQRRLNATMGALSVLFLVPIVWSGWANFSSAWRTGGYYDGGLEIAEWPGRLAFLVGMLIFVARSIHRVFSDYAPADEGQGAATKGKAGH
jgi:TRAP-type C4-dicarboxylate transport system permease small subunit